MAVVILLYKKSVEIWKLLVSTERVAQVQLLGSYCPNFCSLLEVIFNMSKRESIKFATF